MENDEEKAVAKKAKLIGFAAIAAGIGIASLAMGWPFYGFLFAVFILWIIY